MTFNYGLENWTINNTVINPILDCSGLTQACFNEIMTQAQKQFWNKNLLYVWFVLIFMVGIFIYNRFYNTLKKRKTLLLVINWLMDIAEGFIVYWSIALLI